MKLGPKWDIAKLELNHYLSTTDYIRVADLQFEGDTDKATVIDHQGVSGEYAKGLIENMYSATHYSREVNMSMTGLAELLQSVQDVIFTIKFKR